jgi:hypothetical protein
MGVKFGLTLREEQRLRVFENIWIKEGWQEVGENCIMRSFMICTLL